jgi:hypothetical protein
MRARSWLRGVCLVLVVGLGVVSGCGGDDDGGSSSGSDASGGATAVVEDLAARATTEFEARADGLFYDTGVMSYCRMNTGFAGGVFEALGYTDADAPSDQELCYNTSADRTKVALGVTDSSGTTTCVVLAVEDGAVVAGAAAEVDACLP